MSCLVRAATVAVPALTAACPQTLLGLFMCAAGETGSRGLSQFTLREKRDHITHKGDIIIKEKGRFSKHDQGHLTSRMFVFSSTERSPECLLVNTRAKYLGRVTLNVFNVYLSNMLADVNSVTCD